MEIHMRTKMLQMAVERHKKDIHKEIQINKVEPHQAVTIRNKI